jgi:hypothetical protein
MLEVSSGCYGSKQCPCCYLTYVVVSPEGIQAGPCCAFCGLCVCPCPPGCCGAFKPEAPGSATFKDRGEGTSWKFTSRTEFVANGKYNGKDDPHVRFC